MLGLMRRTGDEVKIGDGIVIKVVNICDNGIVYLINDVRNFSAYEDVIRLAKSITISWKRASSKRQCIIGVDAPRDITVLRGEIQDRSKQKGTA